MAGKKAQEAGYIKEAEHLVELLARIPTEEFVSFIARSSVDRQDARELCNLVRALRP